jgi:ATP-dependent RNA helicase RhlE
VTPVSSTAETIQQYLYFVDKKDKRSLLLHILKDDTVPTALVFTRTKHGADKVAQGLTRAGIRAEAIHGNKSQNARQRALVNFKSRHTRILVATDIAARGIDIDDLTHVINFELPNVPETYVHRIGRTGRAGASGIALSFCDGDEEKEYLRDIQKLIARQIPVVEDHPHVLYGGISVDAVPTVASAAPGAGGNGHPTRHNSGTGNRNQSGGGRRPGQRGNGQQQGNGRRNPGGDQQNNSNPRRRPENQGGEQRNNPAGGGQRNNPNGGRPPRREQPAEQLEPMPGENFGGNRVDEPQPPVNTGQPEGGNAAGVAHNKRPEPQRDRQQSGNQGGQPDGKRGAGGPPKPPRKNAGELKMPEQGKAYKDPTEDLGLKINRIEGDEKW